MVIKRPRVALPSTTALAHGDRLPVDSALVSRTLYRLSRSALLMLAQHWLSDEHQPMCAPYILSSRDRAEPEAEAEAGMYAAARSLEELRELYADMQARRGTKKEVIDRIVEGDWVRTLFFCKIWEMPIDQPGGAMMAHAYMYIGSGLMGSVGRGRWVADEISCGNLEKRLNVDTAGHGGCTT